MSIEHEVKNCPFALKELDQVGKFVGHAAVFGNVDLQGDRLRRNAFKETIEETSGRWPILFGHNTGRVVGFSTHAAEDSKGLYVEGEFTLDSDEGRNAHQTCLHAQRVGQKFGLSIGYMVRGDDGASYDQQTGIRTLKSVDVLEFSLAAIPANPRARMAAVKSAGEWTIRDLEQYLRDAGLSKEAACAVASRGFGALNDRRDADAGEEEKAVQACFSELQGKSILFQMKGH